MALEDPIRLRRVEENLGFIRDKIDDAERINGSTRSSFLSMLDISNPSKNPDTLKRRTEDEEAEEESDFNVELMTLITKTLKKKKSSVDLSDLLGLVPSLKLNNFTFLPKGQLLG